MKFIPLLTRRANLACANEMASEPVRRRFVDSLHLVVLTTFAATQPIYDRLGERPAFLADSGVGFPAILLLVFMLSVAVPAIVAGGFWGVGRWLPRTAEALFPIVVYLLLTVIALPVVKYLEGRLAWLTIGLALASAGAVTCAYFASRHIRSIVTVASPAVVIFPALFLCYSPVARMYFPATRIEAAHGDPAPVVMIVFDEFRGSTLVNQRGEIDAERFPHFGELARGSTWFRNATTVHPDTGQAVPALLSGKYPSMQRDPQPDDLPQNLFTVLGATDEYELTSFEPFTRLAPTHSQTAPPATGPIWAQVSSIMPTLARVYLAHLTPAELQGQIPRIPRLWFGLHDAGSVDRTLRRGVVRYNWGDDRRAQFEHFLDCLVDSPKPGLYFMHVILPHVPWCYLPSGRRYMVEINQWELFAFDTHGEKMDLWGADELYVVHSQQRQLLQLQFTDALVGKLLARLRETGLYDKCLLIVTADHGISFKPGDSCRVATPGNIADIMSIPLFVKKPGQQEEIVSDKNVESVDILPTIAGLLGTKLELSVDGRPMFDASLPERTEKTLIVPDGRRSIPATVVDDVSAARELRARFGAGNDPEAMFRIGPHAELVGQHVESLPAEPGPGAELELIRSGTHYSEDRDELAPCYFEGRVVRPKISAQPACLALAVNGVIHAVTRTYQLDGFRDRWAAMVPESAFHVGQNDVQFYVVSGEAPNLRLALCQARTTSPE